MLVVAHAFMKLIPLLFLAACASALQTTNHVQDEAALMTADEDFAKDSLAQGLPAWTARFAKDGAMLMRGELQPVSAIAPALGKGSELHWAPEQAHASGDLGYTIGSYTALQGGKEIVRGRYVTIWKRSAGSWKIVLDAGSEAESVSH